MVLAFMMIAFVATKSWIKSLIAIALGVFVGLIGVDANNDPRFTFGWDYLIDGIEIIPVVAGLFGVPELMLGFKQANKATATAEKHPKYHKQQLWDGIKVTFKEWKLALRGGGIGALIGVLPGLGGGVSDWMAYSSAAAANPRETFGNGNIKGVIGPEGSNNAHKASAFIPTVLFGIPGAEFAAIVMALFMYLGFEMGTPALVHDDKFFDSLSYGFLLGTLLTYFACIILLRGITRITYVPYKYYFPILLCLVIWASMQYTGGWEDLAILSTFSILGFTMKTFKFSRPAALIAFILADRIYNYTYQVTMLYHPDDLITRPIFIAVTVGIISVMIYGLKSKNKLEFA